MTEYIIGTQGPPGIQGPAGPEGRQGIQGGPGSQGPQGGDGSSLSILGERATKAALPLGGVEPGNAYVTTDTGKLWIWSGNAWIDAGQFRGLRGFSGMPGSPGAPGEDGKRGTDGVSPDPVDLSNWVSSRADNLVSNGNGYLRNATNFSQFSNFSLTDVVPGSSASFQYFVQNGVATPDDRIPLPLGEEYVFTYFIKQTAAGKETATFSAGIQPHDSVGNVIQSHHYAFLPNTTTTLAADLRPGDSTVQLTSSSGWYDGPDARYRNLMFWNYQDQTGKQWTEHTYTRNVSDADVWVENGINRTDHTIALTSAWTYALIPAGTPVSNSIWGNHMLVQDTIAAGSSWTRYDKIFMNKLMGGASASTGRSTATFDTGLPPGTTTVKPVWHLNKGVEGSIHALSGVSISSTAALRIRTSEADLKATEAINTATNLQTDLVAAELAIEGAKADLASAKTDIATAKTDAANAFADATAAHSAASTAVQEAQDAWNKAVAAEDLARKSGAVVKIDSSRGILFKHNEVNTVLSVTVYKGDTVVTDIIELQEAFGAGSYLEWQWQRMEEETFGVISSADTRLSAGGFKLTLSPADVSVKSTFRCVVHAVS